MNRAAALLGCSLLLTLACAGSAAAAPGPVLAGAAKVDGTYNVGSSAGQYASTRYEGGDDGNGPGYGNTDPHAQTVKNKASYGVQSRESVRALVVKGSDGKYAAIVSDDHYIPQDGLQKRTAQLASAATGGALNATNITLSVTHNHSSPSYSSFNPGVWTFQDAFDFRFFDYYAHQNAAALVEAFNNLHKVRVSATVSYFDKIQRSPLGAGTDDDGAPAGFTDSYSDHDLSVIRFENIDDPANPRGLSTLVNLGQHPEFLDGYDLITSEYPGAMERMVDRTVGGITIFTQNATGNSEIEKERYHPVEEREAFDHTQYNQMEWAARQLADGVIANVRGIETQTPNADDTSHFQMASYHDRFVPWQTDFEVGVEDRWFPGPVSHPYPGVNSCRTDALLSGNIRVGTAADCTEAPFTLPTGDIGITTDTFEELGIPFPENISTPSHAALEDTLGVHMQAIRLGDILLTVCSCEQWTDQAYNIKTRTDRVTGNEWLGYDPTDAPKADDKEWRDNFCTPNDDGTHKADGTGTGTWTCSTSGGAKLPDRLLQRHRARTLNDAGGWDEPTCAELGCGAQAESESTVLEEIRGNYTHDDTTVRGGTSQTQDYADKYGYKMVVTVSMANDYNGYIATYRDYMGRDHYRKALTGWGPHSSDFFATRLTRMGHALRGDAGAKQLIDRETDPAVAAQVAPEYTHAAAREIADQAHEEAKVRSIGEASSAAVKAYDATIPTDGLGAPGDYKQPKDIKRFDATTFTWVGGNNYTDNPDVLVQRRTADGWTDFADQSGEVPVSLAYPGGDAELDENAPQAAATGMALYRAGGQTWKWTATFEAMVNRFELVEPSGNPYQATPAGTYRFVVHGDRRSGNKNVPYSVISDTFKVAVWDGITIENVAVAGDRHITFNAGPSHQATESRIRGTDRSPLPGNATAFTIGPVDFPDFAADQAAQGYRFLNKIRGYSANTIADAQHYCLDCRFRDWLDATSDLTATVTFSTSGGQEHVEKVHAAPDGTFRTDRALGNGESADIVIEDAWGNRTAAPAHVD